ncbi:hypothetical protein [Rhodococcoides kyotonense]|uniref:Uncharacterized protein n=1 Tax=Rhodococcoides kyotonense TaxID=398843 RepID=A0A239KFR7_9NOCA|nr:hypothetical protein [Rhodococcus kyotonensis]SNT16552.1 hypothetical protein SAMN05421642_110119 [Rhodococcus kyotonensis]
MMMKKSAVAALCAAAAMTTGVLFAPAASASPLSDLLGSLNLGSSAPSEGPPVGQSANANVRFEFGIQGTADFTGIDSSCIIDPPAPRNVFAAGTSVTLPFDRAGAPDCAGRFGSVSYSVALRGGGSTSYGNFDASISPAGEVSVRCTGTSGLTCRAFDSTVTFGR